MTAQRRPKTHPRRAFSRVSSQIYSTSGCVHHATTTAAAAVAAALLPLLLRYCRCCRCRCRCCCCCGAAAGAAAAATGAFRVMSLGQKRGTRQRQPAARTGTDGAYHHCPLWLPRVEMTGLADVPDLTNATASCYGLSALWPSQACVEALLPLRFSP